MLIPKKPNRLFPIECVSCGKSFVIEAKYKGKKLPCPRCSEELVINEKDSVLSGAKNEVNSSKNINEKGELNSQSGLNPPELTNEQSEIRSEPKVLGIFYSAIAFVLVVSFAVWAKVAVKKIFIKKPTESASIAEKTTKTQTSETALKPFAQNDNNKNDKENNSEAVIIDPGIDPKDMGVLNFVKMYAKEKDPKESEEYYQRDLNDAQEKLQDLLKRNIKEAQLLNLNICLFKKDALAAIETAEKLLSQKPSKAETDKIYNILYENAFKNEKTVSFSDKITDYLSEKNYHKAREYKALSKNDIDSLKVLAEQGNAIAAQKLLEKYFIDKNHAGLQEYSKLGNEVASKLLVQLYIDKKDKANLKKEGDKGNIAAKKAWEQLICESGTLDEIKCLAESGNEDAKKKYEERIIKNGSVEEIIILSHAGSIKAKQEVNQIIISATSKNDLQVLCKMESMGVEDAIDSIIEVIFITKKWELLSNYYQKYCEIKKKRGEEEKIAELSYKILCQTEIKSEYTVPAWSNLRMLADQGQSDAQDTCAHFLFNEDLIKKYKLQDVVQINMSAAEHYITEIIKKNPSRGYYIMGYFFYRQKNFSSSYENYEKAANQGNFEALKDQILLLSNSQGQAASLSQILLCRYMAQGLNNGSDPQWIASNNQMIHSLEADFKYEFIEKLKLQANLRIDEIKKRKKKNVKQNSDKRNDIVSSGTGFFINETGFVLTAAHVIGQSDSVTIVFNKKKRIAKPLILDIENDIAILKIDTAEKVPFLSFSKKQPEQGDKVSTFGFPVVLNAEDNDIKFKSGDISSLRGIEGDLRKIRLNLDVDPGNSGGPLLDANSKVIGVILSKRNWKAMLEETGELSGGISYAIKNEYIFPILEMHHLEKIISFDDSTFKASDSIVEVQAK